MINYIAPFNKTSYGYVSCFMYEELSKLGLQMQPKCISHFMPEERFNYIGQKCLDFGHNFYYDADCLKIWHQHDLNDFVGRGRKIGYTIFELDSFNKKEVHNIEYCDTLVVCSQWAKSVVEQRTSKRDIQIVPLGVDPKIFRPYQSSRDTTVFGNFGKWELRKGHDILCQAFNDAFLQEDDVELWLCPHNFFLKPEQTKAWENYYLGSKLGSKIKIWPRQDTQADVYSIMREIDCGVFPSRAEGWNLEALECMACNKKVIITNCTAHTEFCNDENSLLLDLPDKETAYDGVFFNGSGKWHKFDNNSYNDLVNTMREVHSMKKSGNTGNLEGIKTAQKYTWSNSAKIMKGILNG